MLIADGNGLREMTAADDPHRQRVEAAGALAVKAETGANARKAYPCSRCPSASRGDMTVVLDGENYCDACWTGLRRQGRIVDGALVEG